MRRLMEKENKKIRDDYKKEYNATVRVSSGTIRADHQQLVSFVQHRDPRYKAHQARLARQENTSGASTPQHRDKGRKREEERMKAAAEYQEQAWQVVQDSSEESQAESEAGEALECVACNKTFQSEASWNNHERSKKHKQAMYRYVPQRNRHS